MEIKTLDPKGLMKDAYSIEGITEPECRSIFLDWALGVPIGADVKDWIGELLALYGSAAPDHPMTQVLTDGLGAQSTPKRRGGRSARMRHAEGAEDG